MSTYTDCRPSDEEPPDCRSRVEDRMMPSGDDHPECCTDRSKYESDIDCRDEGTTIVDFDGSFGKVNLDWDDGEHVEERKPS